MGHVYVMYFFVSDVLFFGREGVHILSETGVPYFLSSSQMSHSSIPVLFIIIPNLSLSPTLSLALSAFGEIITVYLVTFFCCLFFVSFIVGFLFYYPPYEINWFPSLLVLRTDEIRSSDLIKVSTFSGFWFQASASHFDLTEASCPIQCLTEGYFTTDDLTQALASYLLCPSPYCTPLLCPTKDAIAAKLSHEKVGISKGQTSSPGGIPFLTDQFFFFQ